MAGYGSVCTFAERLGDPQAADLLRQTLDEERAAEGKLTQLAASQVNASAVQSGGANF
jgi:ferritin-like metal-binding protein YciE